MYIRDLRLADIETNAPIKLREVNATKVQIEYFIEDHIKPLREIVSNANILIEPIHSNVNLSDYGKKQKIENILSAAEAQIATLSDKARQKYNSYLDELSNRIEVKALKGTGDKVVDFLVEQEIRKQLETLKPKEAMNLYRAANSADGDDRLLAAVENNPLNSIMLIGMQK